MQRATRRHGARTKKVQYNIRDIDGDLTRKEKLADAVSESLLKLYDAPMEEKQKVDRWLEDAEQYLIKKGFLFPKDFNFNLNNSFLKLSSWKLM